MTKFKISDKIEVVCQWAKTRNGFKHTATLLIDGTDQEEVKCCYLNRTWERFEFDSVLEKLAENSKVLSNTEKRELKDFIHDRKSDSGTQNLKMVAGIAMLGDIFGKTQKEKNDFKTRILKAGLENNGLIMPEDWDTLSEEEKETRLNGAISQLG